MTFQHELASIRTKAIAQIVFIRKSSDSEQMTASMVHPVQEAESLATATSNDKPGFVDHSGSGKVSFSANADTRLVSVSIPKRSRLRRGQGSAEPYILP